MSRQAVISMPLSFAIVLVAAIGLSGAIRDGDGGREGVVHHDGGTIADPSGPVKPENPEVEARAEVDPPPDPPSPPPVGDRVEPLPGVPRLEPLPGVPRVIASLPGESLRTVSERAYGSAEMAGPLLDANPSVLVEPWRPLPGGTLIRLP
ncbi:hypothetical protein [Tautonia plasticadhaerens]|uniref:Uncharacterized protein n=1 Tax=Tautonia plasticadhaerens TaxID=2527974 RepID=A0A518GYZ6_9BACT|nr:hypothetical protein [Tautonia plasticadhaerens]QDV33834.1 hypothetical protein ElP_17140 [Tautonia plasticadhaerens]